MWKHINLLVVVAVFQVAYGCFSGYQKCENEGLCIPSSYECDGIVDCWFHGSDEEDCDEAECLAHNHTFYCPSERRCITKFDVCDGHKDCACPGDGPSFDEVGCTECSPWNTYHCVPEQKCLIGREKAHRCDGHLDCSGDDTSSDEQGCEQYCAANDRMFCNNETTKCIPIHYWCDNYIVDDCPNGEDERDCSADVCRSLNRSHCSADDKCIPNRWVCDGYDDCSDGEDEKDCTADACALVGRGFCAADEECLDQNRFCDGHKDCSDGSDEENCAECHGSHAYHCTTEQKCIHDSGWDRCDGHPDCTDDIDTASDEQGCDTYCDSIDGELCADDSSRCIPEHWICDGWYDCPNNEDEEDCDDERKRSLPHKNQRYSSSLKQRKLKRRGENDYKQIMLKKNNRDRNVHKNKKSLQTKSKFASLAGRRDQHEVSTDRRKSDFFEKRTRKRTNWEDSHYDRRRIQQNKQVLVNSYDEKINRKSLKRENIKSESERKGEEDFEKRLEQTIETLEARIKRKLHHKNK